VADDPYDNTIEPIAGGEARVNVSGWGYWNVWLTVESYVDNGRHADAVLQPSECVSLARRLAVGAVVCWWKRLPDQVRGRLRSMRRMKAEAAERAA
jgi:hypothetical protein